MDNREKVEGAIHLDRFACECLNFRCLLGLWTTISPGGLLDLTTWAEKDALLKTYNCKDGSNKKCTQWIRSDGKDSSEQWIIKAHGSMHLAYACALLFLL